MPHSVPDSFLSKKNELHGPGAWVWLYTISIIPDQVEINITDNDDAVVFGGKTFHPFVVTHEEIKYSSDGNLNGTQMQLSNIDRYVESILDRYDGLRGNTVDILFVNTAKLEDGARVRNRFRIRAVTANHESATVTLEPRPWLSEKYPTSVYLRARCPFVYKGKHCGFAYPSLPAGVQDAPTCSHLLLGPNGCVEHGQLYLDAGIQPLHPERFGGHPGIPKRRGP